MLRMVEVNKDNVSKHDFSPLTSYFDEELIASEQRIDEQTVD